MPWTLLSYAGSKSITVITTLVLSRLLVPADFGLVALALLCVTLLNVIRDLGLGGTMIARQDLDRDDQRTVLTLMLAMGVITAASLAAAAPLIADFFDEPRLDGVLAALSVTVLIGGLNWFYETLMQRELKFKRRFFALAAQSFSYALVAITLAALGAGVWSLVIGQLVGWVAQSAALLKLTPYRVVPGFDRKLARSVLGTGVAWMGQGGLAAIQASIDYIAVGRVLGAGPTGLYSMAFRLGELPYLGVADPVAKVTFPSFAKTNHEGGDVSGPYLGAMRLVALVACPLGVLLSATAAPFTIAVLGERWEGMIGPLGVLAIWGTVKPLQATAGWLLNSVGLVGLQAIIAAVVIVPMVPAVFVAADLGGATAVSWVVLLDVIVSLLLITNSIARRVGITRRQQLRSLAPILFALVVTWLVGRGGSIWTEDLDAGYSLIISGAAGAIAYLGSLSLADRRALPDAISQIRRTLGRGGEPGDPR